MFRLWAVACKSTVWAFRIGGFRAQSLGLVLKLRWLSFPGIDS